MPSASQQPLASTILPSPVGDLTLVADHQALVAILWPNDRPRRVVLPECHPHPNHPILLTATHQLTEYFAGRRTVFTVPLAPRGTSFQQAVWRLLRTIPFGETRTYAQLAKQLGSPTATRAVGAANGRNPISIIVPCHRIIGSSGKLTGFAGGLEAKAHLLDLESSNRRTQLQIPLQ
jgi:methylated-DNA-[protein]-cysteine S-methyltransferase